MFLLIEVSEKSCEICQSGGTDYFRENSPNHLCNRHLRDIAKYADPRLVKIMESVKEHSLVRA